MMEDLQENLKRPGALARKQNDEMNRLNKLPTPARCSLFTDWMQQCGQEAHWIVNGEFVCDEHIQDMADGAGFNDEDATFLQRALDDIAARTEKETISG